MTLRVDKKLEVERAFSGLIGKTIRSVVVAYHENGHPRSRLFLEFSDELVFEIWTDDEPISTSPGLEKGCSDILVEQLRSRENTQIRVFRAPHEDPGSTQKDLLNE